MTSPHEYDVVVVAPNAAIDSYYVLPELIVGDVNRAAQTIHTAGGKGNNMARAVAMLGGRVLSLGIVGGGSGQFIVEELQREGITADMVQAAHETRRCNTLIAAASSQSTITVILENGSPVGDEAQKALTEKVLIHAAKTPYIAFTGSLPPDFPDDYYAVLVEQVMGTPTRATIDCSGKPLQLAAKACPSIIKVNAVEFKSAFGAGLGVGQWNWGTAVELAGQLDVELLIVTDGAHGAYVLPYQGTAFNVATKVDAWVNTTGAGDTFMAGLLLALNRGEPLEQAARFASAAAAASLQQVGSGFLERGDVERFLRVTHVEPLKGAP